MTWTGASAAFSGTFVSRAPVRTAWGVATHTINDVGGGADYQLVLREVYPMILSEDRPLTITERLPEGRA